MVLGGMAGGLGLSVTLCAAVVSLGGCFGGSSGGLGRFWGFGLLGQLVLPIFDFVLLVQLHL